MKVKQINKLNLPPCHHRADSAPGTLAIVAIGNTLRGDAGIASALLAAVPKGVLAGTCVYDLGIHSNYLRECLAGHKAAIIIDCTKNGNAPGTVIIADLVVGLNRDRASTIASCHGLSIMDELHLAAREYELPSSIIFFGVEADKILANDKLSETLEKQAPKLVAHLSLLIETIKERSRADAAKKQKSAS